MSNKINRWTIVSTPYKRSDRKTTKLYVDVICECGVKNTDPEEGESFNLDQVKSELKIMRKVKRIK